MQSAVDDTQCSSVSTACGRCAGSSVEEAGRRWRHGAYTEDLGVGDSRQPEETVYGRLHICIWVPYVTRNSSGDEIANVNFLYDDIVHALQNIIDSCVNSAADRRGYVSKRTFTKFSKIKKRNGHYAVQGHSRSPILVPIESSYTTSY